MIENNNQELINKLINGKDNVEFVSIDFNNELLEFGLRPLTSGELADLKALEQRPYNMNMELNKKGKRTNKDDTKQSMSMEMDKFTKYNSKVLYNAVAWSLSYNDIQIKASDIRKMDNGLPELLFKEVIRISKLTDKDLTMIKTFRL